MLVLHLLPRFLGDVAGAQLRPVLPDIGAAAERPCRASHRAASGRAGMKIAGRFMLIAPISSAGVVLSQPPISTQPSAGYERKQLLRLHREQVAIEHRRRLLERLGQRDRGHLDREAARLPDPALHFLGALPEMRVARD